MDRMKLLSIELVRDSETEGTVNFEIEDDLSELLEFLFEGNEEEMLEFLTEHMELSNIRKEIIKLTKALSNLFKERGL